MKSIYTFLLFLISQSFFAQNGQIDPSFGTNGLRKVVTNLYGYSSTPNPPCVDKVIFGSTTETVYLTNNIKTKAVTLTGGSTTSTFSFPDYVSGWESVMRFNDALFDTNQYIYMAGYTAKEDNNKAFFLARLKRGTGSNNYRWSMDRGFNIDGKLVFDTPEVDEEAVAIKLTTDGKIFIAGYSGNKGIVVRYNSDGFLDKTFNQGGFATFQIGSNCKPTSMVVQPDGKVVVAGNNFNGSDKDFFLTRYNTDGTLDTAFGTNGIIVKDVNNQDNTGNTLVIAADGSLLIGGKAYTITDPISCSTLYGFNCSIFRYTSSGQLMTSFTNGNIPGAYIGTGCYLVGTQRFALASEINNMIYKDGWIYGVGSQERYNSPYRTGRQIQLQVDTTNGGHSFNLGLPLVNFNVNPVCVEMKPSDNTFYTVVQYDNCNVGKTPFLKSPTNTYPTTCFSSSETSILFKKIVKTSTGFYGLDNSKKLFKMDTNFNLDTSFATNGYISDVMSFNVDSNDKIICNLGEANTESTKFLIARYDTSGKQDAVFGFYGTVPITPLLYINGMTPTSQNDYLVTKTYALNGNTKVSLSKLTNTGQLDPGFGTGGSLELCSVPIISSGYSQLFAAQDIVKDSLGNYYALVYHIAGGNGPAFVRIVKVLANGTIDTTFGINGTADITTSITLNTSHKVNIAINTVNGKLLLYNKNKLCQFNLNGSVDSGFGANGVYDANLLLTDFTINKVLVKGSDYFIGGMSITGSMSNIIKVNSLGVMDTSFGTNAGYYQEINSGNPSFVQLKDMFLDANSIFFYFNGIKKIN